MLFCLLVLLWPVASFSTRVASPPLPELHANDVPSIVKMLRSDNDQDLLNGLSQIVRVKPLSDAASAVNDVVAITRHAKRNKDDYYYSTIQAQALSVLGLLPKTKESTNAIYQALESPEQDVRRAAAQNVPADDEHSDQNIRAFRNKDWQVRSALIDRLRIKKPLKNNEYDLLSLALADENEFVRYAAASVIQSNAKERKEFAPSIIKALAREIESPSKINIGFTLAAALAETGGATKNDLPILLKGLEKSTPGDSSQGMQYNIARVIGQIGPDAAEAVPVLKKVVESTSIELLRGYSVEALGRIGPASKDAIPFLIRIIEERKTPNYRYMAVEALGRIANDKDEQANHALILAASDSEYQTQKHAFLALQAQKNHSPDVIKSLKELSIAKNSPNATLYLETLKMLNGDSGTQELKEPDHPDDVLFAQVNDDDEKVQQTALLQIKNRPTVSGRFVPGLVKALSAKDTLNAWYACEALGKAGITAKDAASSIMQWIKSQQNSSTGLSFCTKALALVAPDNEVALIYLRDVMMEGRLFFSEDFALALAYAGDAGVPLLIEGLESDKLYVIYIAALGLANTTGNAKTAVPLLYELLKQPNKLGVFTTAGLKTSDRIIEALRHIAPDDPGLKQAIKDASYGQNTKTQRYEE